LKNRLDSPIKPGNDETYEFKIPGQVRLQPHGQHATQNSWVGSALAALARRYLRPKGHPQNLIPGLHVLTCAKPSRNY